MMFARVVVSETDGNAREKPVRQRWICGVGHVFGWLDPQELPG